MDADDWESIQNDLRSTFATYFTNRQARQEFAVPRIADELTTRSTLVLTDPGSPITLMLDDLDDTRQEVSQLRDRVVELNESVRLLQSQMSTLIEAFTDRVRAWKTLEGSWVALSMIADHESSCTDVHVCAQIRSMSSAIAGMLGEERYSDEAFDAPVSEILRQPHRSKGDD